MLTSSSYCNQDEENDPSPEYEEYLSCVVCGDNGMSYHEVSMIAIRELTCFVPAAHRQCARDANTLSTNDGLSPISCMSNDSVD